MAEQNLPGAYENPYKFNAKELDKETNLYYYGARYYNPRLSIWYDVDALAEKMPSWSPYVYTFNNPVNFVDPDGRKPLDWYQNSATRDIQWFDGSGSRSGYDRLNTATRIITYTDLGGVVGITTLNDNGSITHNDRVYSGGGTIKTGENGIFISSKPGFNLEKWLSHLGNTGGDYYSNTGGNGLGGSSPFFRPDIDNVVDTGGYFGAILNGLARGR